MKQSVYDYSYEMRILRKVRIIRAFVVFFSIVIFLSLIMHFILFPVYIRSDSMENGLGAGSAVFVTPLDKTPERGEMFLLSRQDEKKFSFFESFINQFFKFFTFQSYSPIDYTKNTTGKDSVRRVLALPGDTVYMKDYILYIKPAGQSHFLTEFELSTKKYNVRLFDVPSGWDSIGSNSSMDEIVLGKNEYFVLADNRVSSVDSRHYGVVSSERFRGRVFFEYFPFRRISFF